MPHGKPDFSQLEAPVLGHFGDDDDFVPVDDAKALEREIADATDHPVEFVFYDGAGHAFSNDTTGSAPTTTSRAAGVVAHGQLLPLEFGLSDERRSSWRAS